MESQHSEIKFPANNSLSATEKNVPVAEREENSRLHEQLVKLGDMMGDGLHYEADGKWISAEYKRICRILFPEKFQRQRKAKAEAIDASMKRLLMNFKCECGGIVIQKRSGCKVAYCGKCNKRYVANNRKKKT